MVDGVVSPGFFSIRIVQGRLFGSLIDVLYRGTPTALVALGMAVVIGTKGIDLSVGAVIAIVGAVMTNLIHRDMSPPLVLALTLGDGPSVRIMERIPGRHPRHPADHRDADSDGRRPRDRAADRRGLDRHLPQRLLFGDQHRRIPHCAVAHHRLPLAHSCCSGCSCAAPRSACSSSSVGGNSAAADLAGINAKLVKIGAYTLSGLCSGIAGVLICADIRGSDSNNAGLFIELDAILAVVIGGGSLAGGRFYLGLTIIGVLVIQGLTTSILVSGLPAQYNMVVKGVVVLIVLLLQSRRLRESIVGAVPREKVMRERYLPLLATITVFVLVYAVGGVSFKYFLSTHVLGDLLTDNAFIIIAAIGDDFRHPFRRYRPLGRFDDRLRRRRHGASRHARVASPGVGRVDDRLRRRVRRLSGLDHRFLRDPALHHHSGRLVSSARQLLHGQSRIRSPSSIPSSTCSPIGISISAGAAVFRVPPW